MRRRDGYQTVKPQANSHNQSQAERFGRNPCSAKLFAWFGDAFVLRQLNIFFTALFGLEGQIPQDAGENDAGADEDQGVNALVEEHPANNSDQRNPEEVERDDDARVAITEGFGD